MSQIRKEETQFAKHDVLGKVCDRLAIPFKQAKAGEKITESVYSRSVTGDCSFRLEGWMYPCVLNGADMTYDNHLGHWGDVAELNKLKSSYARQVTVDQLQQAGYYVESEQALADGTLECVLAAAY